MLRNPLIGKKLSDLIEIMFLVVGWMFLLFLVPHHISGDGPLRYQAIEALIEHRQISPVMYSLIGPLFSAPLYLLGKWIGTPEWWVARFNTIFFGLGALLIHQLLQHSISSRLLRRFLLLTMLASMMSQELLGYGAEAFNSVSVAAGLAAWITGRWVLGSVLLSVGVANTPGTIIGLALAMLVWVLHEKRFRGATPVLFAVLIWGAENWFRRGSPLITGYELILSGTLPNEHPMLPYTAHKGFTYPLLFGLLSYLFSFGKGLLFFAPALFLPLRNRTISPAIRDLYRYCMMYLLGLAVTYAQWWAWFGGVSWGPRFLLFASFPASLVLTTRLDEIDSSLINDTLTALALALCFWVGFSGITFGMEGQQACVVNNYINEPYCWYVPEWSVLWHPFVQPRPLSFAEWAVALFYMLVLLYFLLPLARRISLSLYRRLGPSVLSFINGPSWRF
jgi:hypothetical protein